MTALSFECLHTENITDIAEFNSYTPKQPTARSGLLWMVSQLPGADTLH